MTDSELTTDRAWIDVDQAADPAEFVRYLDEIDGQDQIQAYKRRTYALLKPLEGARILEVGCGTGEDARALARLVGAAGYVTGVDNSSTMISEARQRSAELGLPVEFVVGDAHRLDVPENTFDGARADRTLQHLDDPQRALSELVRAVRPGGRVVVMEPDWDAIAIDAADRTTTRRIRDTVADAVQHGTMGRRLPGLFQLAGLVEIAVMPLVFTATAFAVVNHLAHLEHAVATAVAAGEVSEKEGTAWLSDLQRADSAGTFFTALTGFIVAGRKP